MLICIGIRLKTVASSAALVGESMMPTSKVRVNNRKKLKYPKFAPQPGQTLKNNYTCNKLDVNIDQHCQFYITIEVRHDIMQLCNQSCLYARWQ